MMNKGQDKINIEIKIAGERIMLSVPFDSQEDVRDSEKEIQELGIPKDDISDLDDTIII